MAASKPKLPVDRWYSVRLRVVDNIQNNKNRSQKDGTTGQPALGFSCRLRSIITHGFTITIKNRRVDKYQFFSFHQYGWGRFIAK